VKVWPQGLSETFCTDHWRCRMVTLDGAGSNPAVNWMLLKSLAESGVDVIKSENLYLFDGEKGYSLGQGQ
jgi:isocitrate dehydrogenase